MLVGRFFVGIGGETGITASFFTVNKFIPESERRWIIALIYVVCNLTAMASVYTTSKFYEFTKSFNMPILASLLANLASVILFSLFYFGNKHICDNPTGAIENAKTADSKQNQNSNTEDAIQDLPPKTTMGSMCKFSTSINFGF